MTPEQSKMLQEVRDAVLELSVVIKGSNGYPGLLQTVAKSCNDYENLNTKFSLHEALPAHSGAAEDLKDIKKVITTLQERPGNNAISFLKWALTAITSFVLGGGLLTLLEVLTKAKR